MMVDNFSEFERLLARYQLAWEQWDWADTLHQEQANAELTAAVTALNTYIQEQKGLRGIPTRSRHHTVLYPRFRHHQVS